MEDKLLKMRAFFYFVLLQQKTGQTGIVQRKTLALILHVILPLYGKMAQQWNNLWRYYLVAEQQEKLTNSKLIDSL